MFNSKHLNLHLDVLKHKYISECDKKVKQTLFLHVTWLRRKDTQIYWNWKSYENIKTIYINLKLKNKKF